MKSFIRIIRLPNLIIMALTMFLIRYVIMMPVLDYSHLHLFHSLSTFTLLVLSIILLAAGGNVINDIKDVKADSINKPGDNVVTESMTYTVAFRYYYFLTSLGLLLGSLVSYMVDSYLLVNIHIIIGLALWMYSSKLNNIPLLGNVIVSTLLGSLPWIVLFFDLPKVIISTSGPDSTFEIPVGTELTFQSYFTSIIFLIFAYSIFAYLQNLAREITKDIIDVRGDKTAGYRTAPTIFGISLSIKVILASLLLLFISYVLFLTFVYSSFPIKSIFSFLVLAISLFLPMIYSIFLLLKSKDKLDFKKLSQWNKISQVIGLLSTLYFYYIFS